MTHTVRRFTTSFLLAAAFASSSAAALASMAQSAQPQCGDDKHETKDDAKKDEKAPKT